MLAMLAAFCISAMNLFEFVLLRPPSCNATLSTEHRLTLKSLLERQYCLSYHIANQVLLTVLFLIHEHVFTIKDIVSCFHQNRPPENRWHFWDTPGRNLKT